MEQKRELLRDADANAVITVCGKCYVPGPQGIAHQLRVSDKPNHVFCETCGDYQVAEIWGAAEANHG